MLDGDLKPILSAKQSSFARPLTLERARREHSGAAEAAPGTRRKGCLLHVAGFEVRLEEVELLFGLDDQLLEEVGTRLVADFVDLV